MVLSIVCSLRPELLSQYMVIAKQLENMNEEIPDLVQHFACVPRMSTPNPADIPLLLRTREDPEMEEEERRNGREPPEPKRRRIRDADSASVGSSTRSAKTREGGSDRQESAVPASAEPSTSTAIPQAQPPQPPTDSHLRQPYNTHTFPLQSTPSSLSQALEPPVNITVQPPISRSVVAPAASQARIPYTQPPTVAVVPVTAQAVQTSAPIPTTALRMLEGEIHRMREETRRLSEENRRLNDENTRLTEENRRLRAQPSALCPPDLISAVKDSMASTLGSRVAGREYPL